MPNGFSGFFLSFLFDHSSVKQQESDIHPEIPVAFRVAIVVDENTHGGEGQAIDKSGLGYVLNIRQGMSDQCFLVGPSG